MKIFITGNTFDTKFVEYQFRIKNQNQRSNARYNKSLFAKISERKKKYI